MGGGGGGAKKDTPAAPGKTTRVTREKAEGSKRSVGGPASLL